MPDTVFPNSLPPSVGSDLTIVVRAGGDPAAPHRGRLSIGDWSVPCVVGRSGVVSPALKREGDGATPSGRFALRYGFYEPGAFGDAVMAALAFPFKPKPVDYDWIENPASADYNRMRAHGHNEPAPERAAHLFDLFVPLGWNDAVPVSAGGSAIFLHAARPEMTGTAGCVAVPHAALMDLAQRLRPGMIIDIATEAAVPVQEPPGMLETVSFHGLEPGPKVIVTGAVHGNEPCGPRAITRMIEDLRAGRRQIRRGTVTFVPVVNGLAYRQNRREGERNLNRALREYPVPASHEDRVANLLCPLLRAHDVLIDLHSFAAEGPAFALIGPEDNTGDLEPFAGAAQELKLAQALGLSLVVHGWMPAHRRALEAHGRAAAIGEAVGTSEYMRFAGGAAVTVECGRHDDPVAAETAFRVLVRGLAQLGLLLPEDPEAPAPALWEIADAIFAESDADRLIRRFRTGETVTAGEVIGHRADGSEITAPYDGAVIFASGKVRAGSEMCFLCRASLRHWA